MTLVNIVVILVVVGLVMWLINTYIPMAGAIKSLLNIVVFVVLLIWISDLRPDRSDPRTQDTAA